MTDLHSDASADSRSAQLDRTIRDLLTQAPELEAAAVVSFDGLAMAAALPASMDEDRVAAMSAALLSLGERAAEGLGRGELSQVYIEGDNGTVFLVSADDEAVLVAVASKGSKAGMMLYEVRRAAAVVAAVLRAEQAPEPSAVPEVAVVRDLPAVPAPAAQIPAQPTSAPAYEAPLPAGYAQPVLAHPHDVPVYDVPVYDVPVYDVPVYDVPVYEAPVSPAPVHEAPTYQTPTYQTPAFSAPVPEAPVPEARAYEAPVYEAPVYEAPVYELPVYLAQQYVEPTHVEQAPVQPPASAPDPSWPPYAPTGSVMPGGGVPPSTWS
jgi:predicted regulator of Ras-like GTPase activity (Roadblock/LC7/MglB family)